MEMTDYDDADELQRYVLRNGRKFMTPLERDAEQLGVLREKANRPGTSESVKKELEGYYDARVREETRKLIGESLEDVLRFRQRVARRIEAEKGGGKFRINRCPVCDRIVKTPQAHQCLWCGHDWHNGSK